jgi:hypothetical protein
MRGGCHGGATGDSSARCSSKPALSVLDGVAPSAGCADVKGRGRLVVVLERGGRVGKDVEVLEWAAHGWF